MDKKTKIIIIIASIAVIALASTVGYFLFEKRKIKSTDSEVNNTIVEEVEENEIIEEDTNTIEEEEENTVEEENVTNEVEIEEVEEENQEVQDQIIGREEQESVIENQGPTDEEKVMELVKNEWGANDETVTFNIMNHDGEIYMVSVNDKNTTAVKAWYQVNVSTGEVTQ